MYKWWSRGALEWFWWDQERTPEEGLAGKADERCEVVGEDHGETDRQKWGLEPGGGAAAGVVRVAYLVNSELSVAWQHVHTVLGEEGS